MNSHAARRKRYWGVTIYFLLAGALVFFAWAFLDGYGNSIRGMSPSGPGGSDTRGLYLLWAIAIYALAGAIAGALPNPRHRVYLTWLAHLTIVISVILPSENPLTGAFVGCVLCVVLAIPFGLAWFILIADSIW